MPEVFLNEDEALCKECGEIVNKINPVCKCIKKRGILKTETKEGNPDFIKFDTGKLQMSLVEPAFVEGTAKILTIGAQKYAPNNWKLLPKEDIDRYKDALLRHLYAYLSGEKFDPETKEPHLDHISCNVMFLRYYEHQLKEEDGK